MRKLVTFVALGLAVATLTLAIPSTTYAAGRYHGRSYHRVYRHAGHHARWHRYHYAPYFCR